MPSICIAIVTYRSDATIARCLSCLEEQSYKDFEVVIVENGLTPSLAKLGQTKLKLQIIPKDNIGFAAGNNLAASLAAPDTKWVVALNPDAYAHPDWLEKFVRATKRYPDVAMFGSLQLEATRLDFCDGRGDCYHAFGLAWRRQHGWRLPKIIDDTEAFSPCGAAAFYRIDLFHEVGGFDESFFCYFEDVDIGFRMRLLGHNCIQLADTVVDHVGGASGTNAFAISHALRNIMLTYVKNMPAPLFYVLFPAHIATVLMLAMRYAVAGHADAAKTAIKNGVAGYPGAWQQRQMIQKKRKASLFSIMGAMTWLPTQPFRHLLRPRERKYFAD